MRRAFVSVRSVRLVCFTACTSVLVLLALGEFLMSSGSGTPTTTAIELSSSSAQDTETHLNTEGDSNVIATERKILTNESGRTIRASSGDNENDEHNLLSMILASEDFFLPLFATPAERRNKAHYDEMLERYGLASFRQTIRRRGVYIEQKQKDVRDREEAKRWGFIVDLANNNRVEIPPWRPGINLPIVCPSASTGGLFNGTGVRYYPTYFSTPLAAMQNETLTHKNQDWSKVIPGLPQTYEFGALDEEKYLEDMRRSKFSVTFRKRGWQTARLLEILQSGSIPYFCDISFAPRDGMLSNLPLELFFAFLSWEGVRAPQCTALRSMVISPLIARGSRYSMWKNPTKGTTTREHHHHLLATLKRHEVASPIDQTVWNQTIYDRIASKLLKFTRLSLNAAHVARHSLSPLWYAPRMDAAHFMRSNEGNSDTTGRKKLSEKRPRLGIDQDDRRHVLRSEFQLLYPKPPRKVLFVLATGLGTGYMAPTFMRGLKDLNILVTDVPKQTLFYRDAPGCAATHPQRGKLWGKGYFAFCRMTETIEERELRHRWREAVMRREYDAIIFYYAGNSFRAAGFDPKTHGVRPLGRGVGELWPDVFPFVVKHYNVSIPKEDFGRQAPIGVDAAEAMQEEPVDLKPHTPQGPARHDALDDDRKDGVSEELNKPTNSRGTASHHPPKLAHRNTVLFDVERRNIPLLKGNVVDFRHRLLFLNDEDLLFPMTQDASVEYLQYFFRRGAPSSLASSVAITEEQPQRQRVGRPAKVSSPSLLPLIPVLRREAHGCDEAIW